MNSAYGRQLLLFVVINICFFSFKTYITLVFDYLLNTFHWLSYQLSQIFAHSYLGDVIRLSLSAILLSVLLGLIINSSFLLRKKRTMPNPMFAIWCIWLLIIARIA